MTLKFPVSISFLFPLILCFRILSAYNLSMSYDVVSYLYLYVGIFVTGVLISKLRAKNKRLKIRHFYLRKNSIKIVLIILFFIFISLNISRFSELASGYYRSSEKSGLFSTIIELIISVSSLFFAHEFWKTRKIYDLVPYFLVLLISFLAASRAVIIIQTIFLFGCGVMSLGSLKAVSKMVLVAVAGILVFFISIGFLRGSFNDLNSFFVALNAYTIGGLFAFESFYEAGQRDWAFSLLNVLPGMAKLLNMLGLSLEVNNYNYTAETYPFITNIYTSFRELITAFGVKGSLVFALLHGFVSGSFDYSETGYGGHNVIGPLLLTGNVFFLWYPITMYVFVVVFMILSLTVKLK